MAGALNVQANILLLGKLHHFLNVRSFGGFERVNRVLSNRASLLTSIRVSSDASAVREDRRAGVVGPLGETNANWVLRMERGRKPIHQDIVANCLVEVGMVRIAGSTWGNGADEIAIHRLVECAKLFIRRPARLARNLDKMLATQVILKSGQNSSL